MNASTPEILPSRRILLLISGLTTVLGAVLAYGSLGNLNVSASDALGLIQALPIGYFIGVGLILLGFVVTVRQETLNRPLLVFQVFILILSLYGLTAYAEHIARLPTTWVHAGFIEYIQRTGQVLKDYDARFVWPGFFAGGALLNNLAATTDSGLFANWAPLFLNLGYALPVWMIARSTGVAERTSWLATVLFLMLNWVGQDYYSPQGVNFLLAISFIAVLLRTFRTNSGIIPNWLNGLVGNKLRGRFGRVTQRVRSLNLAPGEAPAITVTGTQKALLFGALVVIFAASVVSHQLTPFFLFILTLGLVALDRVSTRFLPVLMIVAVFVWISYAASSFWVGQLDKLFGDVGNLNSVVNENVNNRVAGNPAHLPVIYSRLLLTGAVWLTAAFGLLRRIRRGRFDVISVVGFLAPFSVLGGQAYGGEALLRVYLFGLPFAATLAASALAPDHKAWSRRTTGLVTVVLLALIPAYQLTRYGNEAFETFRTGELATVETLYKVAPEESDLFTFNSDVPWRQERIEHYTFTAVFESSIPEDELPVLEEALHPRDGKRAFLLVTTAQKRYAEMMQGQNPAWVDSVVAKLMATGNYRQIQSSADGTIIVPAEQK